MADKATGKDPIEQQTNTSPADASVKAVADTGDRELSDADLDRVAGGAAAEPAPRPRTPVSRAQ